MNRGAATDIIIPRPIHVVLDDVGWRDGGNLSTSGGPFRAGVDRVFGESDYLAVAELGRRLNIRPQCSMILCEWDRENICAKYPTTTQAGTNWDNSARIGDWAFRARDVFVNRAANIEFGLHGVGHEHWEGGKASRAEWFGRGEKHWPRKILDGHMECFRKILAQYGLDPSDGISYPPAFVPCAFTYYWNDSDPRSTGAFMTEYGLRFAATVLQSCTFAGGRPDKPDGGFDHGLLVLDRDNSVPWYAMATVPETMPKTSICGMHWANMLSPDPAENGRAVDLWAEYLSRVADQDDAILAANTIEAGSQWIYHNYASLRRAGGRWIFDAASLPERALAFAESPIIKVRLPAGEHVASFTSADCQPVAYRECGGFAMLQLKLDRPQAEFEISFGPRPLPFVVDRTGTFDVLDLRREAQGAKLKLRIYGSQTVAVRLPFTPSEISVESSGLQLGKWSFDRESRLANIGLSARDIHGQTDTIAIRSA